MLTPYFLSNDVLGFMSSGTPDELSRFIKYHLWDCSAEALCTADSTGLVLHSEVFTWIRIIETRNDVNDFRNVLKDLYEYIEV